MAMIFSDFRPAEYHAGKSSYVAFYVINPDTGNLVRKRIKVNRVTRGQKRDKFARTLCCEINRKLYEGWNPYLENDAYFSGTSMQKGIKEFLEAKGRNVRPDTFRSYHSYLKWFNGFLQRSGKIQMPIRTFTDRDAEKAMKELEARSDIGSATYNSYLEFFRNLFNYFINRNWLKENPFSRIERKREEQKRRELIPPHIRQQIADYFVQTQQIPYLYIMQMCYRCLIRRQCQIFNEQYLNYCRTFAPCKITPLHAPHHIPASPYNRIPAHCTLFIVNCTLSRGAVPQLLPLHLAQR